MKNYLSFFTLVMIASVVSLSTFAVEDSKMITLRVGPNGETAFAYGVTEQSLQNPDQINWTPVTADNKEFGSLKFAEQKETQAVAMTVAGPARPPAYGGGGRGYGGRHNDHRGGYNGGYNRGYNPPYYYNPAPAAPYYPYYGYVAPTYPSYSYVCGSYGIWPFIYYNYCW